MIIDQKITSQLSDNKYDNLMKTILVATGSLFSLGFLSLQQIPIIVNIIFECAIGVITLIYLIRKLKKQKNERND